MKSSRLQNPLTDCNGSGLRFGLLLMVSLAVVSCGGGGGGGGGGSTPADLGTLNSEGLEFLKTGNLLNAQAKFKEATDAAGTQSGNEADTARFFYAVTRVAVLGFDLTSDGNPDDFNRASDVFDRFGCSSGGRDPLNWTVTCPADLPDNSPTGGQLLTILQNVVLPQFDGATRNLDGVSPSFNRSWIEPISGNTVESDQGDVLFYKAVLKGLRAKILILLSYNFDVDIDAEANDATSDAQTRLGRNPSVLTPTTAASTNLPQARTLLDSTADDLIAAADAIQAETDSQTDDLINLDNTTNAEITQAKTDLTTFKNALTAQTTVNDNGTPETTDDVIVDGNPFFSASLPLDLRVMLPPLTGNTPGAFPDTTFGGILVQGPNTNEDLNGNGVPDIFGKTQSLRYKLLK